MLNLRGTPYSLDPIANHSILSRLRSLEERVSLLRDNGTLSHATLKKYYGDKRFEQVAASNALEGSTLSAGETELAILKGITITGHDPAFIRDAVALDHALQRLVELAQIKDTATTMGDVKELHALILGSRPGAGAFRSHPVRISGSSHRPPETWKEVMDSMEVWDGWSVRHRELAAPVRAVVLHAWLAHIHPFNDGNGRTARAISNLELVRAGYPPIIIKKKERLRYIDALGEADKGGDLCGFFEFMIERMEAALVGLELSARAEEGFDPTIARIRKEQERRLEIWMTSVKQLALVLEENLKERLTRTGAHISLKRYDDSLDLEEFLELCNGRAVSKSWSFVIEMEIPAIRKVSCLAWHGYRSHDMHRRIGMGGPSLYWSVPNPTGYPRWTTNEAQSPNYIELTILPENPSEWFVKNREREIKRIPSIQLVNELKRDFLEMVSPGNETN